MVVTPTISDPCDSSTPGHEAPCCSRATDMKKTVRYHERTVLPVAVLEQSEPLPAIKTGAPRRPDLFARPTGDIATPASQAQHSRRHPRRTGPGTIPSLNLELRRDLHCNFVGVECGTLTQVVPADEEVERI